MPFLLTTRTIVPLDVLRVFTFFADAGNLDRLTPPWLHFRMEAAPAPMAPGVLIDYRLRLRGIPFRWRSEITAWDPPHRFVDEQRRGPYRWWIHSHTFAAHEGGTMVADTVDYQPRGGRLLHAALVGPELRRIFSYRETALWQALSVGRPAVRAPITIAHR